MKKLVLIAALTAVAVFGVMASANAASDDVTISASVNSRIVVTAPADHNFGAIDPDAGVQTHSDVVNVRSNVAYTMAQAEAGDASGLFSTSGPAMDGVTSNPKAPSAAGADWAQDFEFDPAAGGDWADSGAYSATYTYTALPF